MIQDLIQGLKRIQRKNENLPKGNNKLRANKATFKAEDKRMNYLAPCTK